MKILSAEKISCITLIEECTETVEEVKLAEITLAENEHSYKCSSYTVYTVSFWILFTINVGVIATYFVYYNRSLNKNNVPRFKFGTRTQTTIH